MRCRLLAVGRGGVPWADEAVRDYARRIRRHGALEEEWVKAEPFRGDVDAVRRAEGERLLARVSERDRLIALDERGEDLDTAAFAELLRQVRISGARELVFAVGGPYGHDLRVREGAWRTLRLSSLVLNHDLARVVLAEQVYRGLSILAGGPYHH